MNIKLISALALCVFFFPTSAQSSLAIKIATVQNGQVYVEGEGAYPTSTILWRGVPVAQPKGKFGKFSFYYAQVPVDCKGTVSDGIQAQSLTLTQCTSALPTAQVRKTGQIQRSPVSDLPGDDGSLQKGVSWPSPRFLDNGDGTFTDILTGLIWMRDPECGYLNAENFETGERPGNTWRDALLVVATLAEGVCGLTDGSVAGDWRLPNVLELGSIVDYSRRAPAVPNPNPFGRGPFAQGSYWTSTAYFGDYFYDAFVINFNVGESFLLNSETVSYVLAVRDRRE